MLDGRVEGRLSPCSGRPVAHLCVKESGSSLVQVWSDPVSDRERTPAPSPEADISASAEGMAGRREGAASERSKKALLISERGIPRRPLRIPVLSVPSGCPCDQEDGMRCLPVESFPRRSESCGDSLQKAACQPRSSSSASSAMATGESLKPARAPAPSFLLCKLTTMDSHCPSHGFSHCWD